MTESRPYISIVVIQTSNSINVQKWPYQFLKMTDMSVLYLRQRYFLVHDLRLDKIKKNSNGKIKWVSCLFNMPWYICFVLQATVDFMWKDSWPLKFLLFLGFITDIDECASAPCQNGGTCTDLQDSFRCECPIAWEGDLCQFGKYFFWFCFTIYSHFWNHLDADECLRTPCINAISCANLVGDYRCKCRVGWMGKTAIQISMIV